ncbi:alcohol dehydrogenase [Penicillium diatomitis]|uniref:Alcohol dehydrogenase n=1 Tax=Penicillium diatomitis TaxID=2819901 RepID=A0A9W9WUF4_9EURO|nr:alcohol dehydrogenase [Penicillium diatomitis]KAJ5476943.1 alcohol dehydrogenase [Penicillium diatomitis]
MSDIKPDTYDTTMPADEKSLKVLNANVHGQNMFCGYDAMGREVLSDRPDASHAQSRTNADLANVLVAPGPATFGKWKHQAPSGDREDLRQWTGRGAEMS